MDPYYIIRRTRPSGESAKKKRTGFLCVFVHVFASDLNVRLSLYNVTDEEDKDIPILYLNIL